MKRTFGLRKAPPYWDLGILFVLSGCWTVSPAFSQCNSSTASPSVWFNEQDGNFDPDLMETDSPDGGSGLYDDLLSNLIVEPNWTNISSWNSFPAYTDLDLQFSWTSTTLQSGETCWVDRLASPSYQSITYKYRRFSLNGATGVVYFHSSFTEPESEVPAYAFIHNFGTCCDLHEDEYLGNQEQDSGGNAKKGLCVGLSVDGPEPPAPGIMALLRPYNPPDDPIILFVAISGGPGPHSAVTRLQQTLLVRKALEDAIYPTTLDKEKYFLTGGSFGSAVALAAQMIYPQYFDGSLVAGNAFSATDAFFGYERFFAHGQGQIALRTGGGGASKISMSDYWTYDQLQKSLEARATTNGSYGFNNLSFLDRFAWRVNNWTIPAVTDPIILTFRTSRPPLPCNSLTSSSGLRSLYDEEAQSWQGCSMKF